MKPLLLMCDNDGTLVDSEAAHFLSVSAVVSRNGGRPINKDEWWNHCSGKGHMKIWEWVSKRDDSFSVDKDDFIKQCSACYLKNIFSLKAKPGLYKALEAFNKATGVMSPVVSNTATHVVEQGLQATGLSVVTGDVYGADYFISRGIKTKPSPEPWIRIAAKYGVSGKDMGRVIIFEDSDSGCKSAKTSGAYVVQIRHHPNLQYMAPKSRYADYYIGSNSDDLKKFTQKAIAGLILK